MSNRIDKYDEIDYTRDRFGGDIPLLEYVILVVVFVAWCLIK